MLTWPHRHGDWRDALEQVEPVYVEIARQVCARQTLLSTCYDENHRRHVEALLSRAGISPEQVSYFIAPSNDSWVRDHGPITVLQDGRPRLLDFTFNGWGGKHPAGMDDRITRCLHQAGAFGDTSLESVDLVLEGGSIETDGAGTLLTTRCCQLSPGRNPQYSEAELETRFNSLFGVERILWLDHGQLAGDDTDSHIDTLARFCDPHTIAYAACDDPSDEHFPELEAMAGELRGFKDPQGAPYRLVPLPIPQPRYGEDGQRLPATYANFLIINGAVLVPTYDDPADDIAINRLRNCFPRRTIIGIDCRPLISQYGSLHCATMQLPAGVV